MNTGYKKFLPHAVAIAIFAIITLIYFKPLWSGKELNQGDISRHKSMSKEIADYRKENKSEPLWTNSMFGGMPAYQISTLYPGNWIAKLDNAFKLFIPLPAGYLFLYCLGFFILLLCLDVNPWLAMVGGVAYGLSSYFLIILEAGHNSKANALGYLPALLGGVILIFKGKHWLGLALTTLFTAMELNCNHVQISYYGYILIGFIILGYFFTAINKKELKTYFKGVALFLIASIIGLLPNAGNLMTTNEYGKYSTRGKSELTINYESIQSARSNAVGLDGNPNKPVATPGLIDNHAKEQHAKNTTTGLDKDYATRWSYGIDETFTILIPDFKGGATGAIGTVDENALKKVNPDYRRQVANSNAYFGDQDFTSGPVYIGAIVCLLALLGMFIIKNRIKWPIFFGTLLTIALAWGRNFMPLTDFFLDYVPGYNKFRAVSMLMVIAELTIPLLAIMAVNELLKLKAGQNIRFYFKGTGSGVGRFSKVMAILAFLHTVMLYIMKAVFKKQVQKDETGREYFEIEPKKVLFVPGVIIGGFCFLCWMVPDACNTFTSQYELETMVRQYVQAGQGTEEQLRPELIPVLDQIVVARKAIFRADALRSLIFVILGFLAVLGFISGKLKKELFIVALGLFITIDLWTVDMRYLNDKSFITKEQNQQSIVAKTAADEEILKDPDPDYRVLNLTASTFNDAGSSYYHKSIGGYHGAKLKKYQELIDFHLDEEINTFYKNINKASGSDSSLNLLMSKLNVINMLNTKYFIIPAGGSDEDRAVIPFKNPQANGSVWFVKNLKGVADADSEIVALYYINTKIQAVLKQKNMTELALKNSYSGEGTIKIVSYKPNHLVYESDSKDEQFAVFSEIYYPKGWNAYVDGQLKPHTNVNYVLRGMVIPAGKHKIEFKFEPESYAKSNTIAMVGSVLLLIIVGAGIYLHRKNKVIVS
ncbi:MAG: Bacterial rane protein YfhO [Bacteroidetes bacterium]|nr:Bacterial rane protein YfhO [Bacteroidota bacterium]